MTICKSDITKEFAKLRKYGFKVFNFNNKRSLYNGKQDWVDTVIAGRGKFYTIEVKIGKDKYSPGQLETKKILSNCSGIINLEVTDKNYKEITIKILQGEI